MKLTLNKKSIEKGTKWSWYLQYYYGSKINDKGKRNHIRDFKFLNIYTFQNPSNEEERVTNEAYEMIVKEIFEAENLKFINEGYSVTTKENIEFINSTKNDVNYAINYLIKNSSKLSDVEFDKLATLFKDNDFVINVLRMKFLDFTDKQKQKLFAFLMPFVSDYIKTK